MPESFTMTSTPAQLKSLLLVWGLQRNMNGETLASFLHALRIKEPLKYLKLPEDLVITVQPVSSLVAVEGRALELNCGVRMVQ